MGTVIHLDLEVRMTCKLFAENVLRRPLSQKDIEWLVALFDDEEAELDPNSSLCAVMVGGKPLPRQVRCWVKDLRAHSKFREFYLAALKARPVMLHALS